MATYPPRQKCLKETVPSLVNQCSRLFIYLNDYSSVPDFLAHPRIEAFCGSKYPSCGDIGKFYMIEHVDGYYFTVDDDIIYPSDYMKRMVNRIEFYQHRAVLGVHGCVLNMNHMHNYYRARNLTNYRNHLSMDRPVHVIGTGTAAFHTSTIKITLKQFPIPNMADIWFALQGQKQKVPFILINRGGFWLKDSPSAPSTSSIYRKSMNKEHGKLQTQTIKNYPDWKIYA